LVNNWFQAESLTSST